MKKIILHVGLHKTGSTSIQMNCNHYRKLLLKNGVYYPKFSTDAWVNHSIPLSLLFMDTPLEKNHSVRNIFPNHEIASRKTNSIKKHLIQEINNNSNKTILLSGEDVSVFSMNELNNLSKFFYTIDDFQFKIIVYIRNPFDFMLSNSQEVVKSGLMPLGKIFKQGNLQQIKLKVEKLIKVFGDNRIKIFNFNETLIQGGVVNHFFNKINIPTYNLNYIRGNESIPVEKLLVISGCLYLGEKTALLLNQALTNKGNPLSLEKELAIFIWKAYAEQDMIFLEKYNIKFENQVKPNKKIINIELFIKNLYHAEVILRENNLVFEPRIILQNIVNDTKEYLPMLSDRISTIKIF